MGLFRIMRTLSGRVYFAMSIIAIVICGLMSFSIVRIVEKNSRETFESDSAPGRVACPAPSRP